MKTCTKCKVELPIDQFSAKGSGKRSICKSCQNKQWQEYAPKYALNIENRRKQRRERYTNDPEYRRKQLADSARRQKNNRETINKKLNASGQVAAYQKIKRLIRRGVIVKPEFCVDCGVKPPKDAHHEDYSKPLEVIWLCHACHMERHMKRQVAIQA